MLGLLQTYETAIGELKGTGDEAVAEFILRLENRRTQALAAIAAANAAAFDAAKSAAISLFQ